jgi:hypothetical protein
MTPSSETSSASWARGPFLPPGSTIKWEGGLGDGSRFQEAREADRWIKAKGFAPGYLRGIQHGGGGDGKGLMQTG